MDTEIKVTNDGGKPAHVSVRVSRDKAAEDGTTWDFFLRMHPVPGSDKPGAVLVPMGDDVTLPERRPMPEEVERAWTEAQIAIPTEVLHYDGDGKAAVPDLARFMAHDAGSADPGQVGITRAEAIAALSEKVMGAGKGHSRSTVRRAWSALREMGYLTPVAALREDDPEKRLKIVEEKTVQHHVWSTS
jgi:hypothetical protein